MIKAVIFDMDGLLIDSEPHWRASHREVLAGHGYHITEDDVRQMAGRRTAEVAQHWQDRFGFSEPSNDQLVAQIVDTVIKRINEQGTAMAGVQQLVKDLYDHGMPMAVASSSSMRLIDVVLERLDIRQYMQAVHSGEHEQRGKPFPDVFLSTAKTLGAEPEQCLVFEDSLNGVKAAKAAGMYCIAVPEEPYDEQAFSIADRIISSLKQVNWADIQEIG